MTASQFKVQLKQDEEVKPRKEFKMLKIVKKTILGQTTDRFFVVFNF